MFAVFEWGVRTGRPTAPARGPRLSPAVRGGGGLLLTRSHASLNLKSEFLVEITHTPLGVLALLVGWARWLELRLAAPEGRLSGRSGRRPSP